MLTLLFAVAFSGTSLEAFDDNLILEHGTSTLIGGFCDVLKAEVDAVFLAPFDEFALEIHLLIGHLIDVYQLSEDAFLHEAHAGFIAFVEVDGAHQRLESVASHVAVVRRAAPIAKHQAGDAHLFGQAVERFALHKFRACVGQEAFTLARKVPIDDVTHDGIEDSIAEKFQPFVVHRTPFCVAPHDTFVHQCQLVVANIVGIEAQDGV